MIAGFQYLPQVLNATAQAELMAKIRAILNDAPLFQPRMPRTGKPLSVQMSNCGPLGWVTDQAGGYRYQATHPVTRLAWPVMPTRLLKLWDEVTAFPAEHEACLINYCGAGTKMGSHRDLDEQDFSAPVVSISLGDDAIFHVGGLKRADAKTTMTLASGDVVVLGGEARRAYHGINRIVAGTSDLLAEGGRFNLTLRRVSVD